jgi:hypothetical protein
MALIQIAHVRLFSGRVVISWYGLNRQRFHTYQMLPE